MYAEILCWKATVFSGVGQVLYYQLLPLAIWPMASEILESREQKTEEKELRQAVGDEGNEEYDWCIGCNLYVCIYVLPKS